MSLGLKLVCEEAERIHDPPRFPPVLVTDNVPSFQARKFQANLGGEFAHVRIPYRTPQLLGLLERFHSTLKKGAV